MDTTSHINQTIDFLIRHISQVESQVMQESELADLSMKQMVCLETISRMENPTFSDLALKLGVSKPSVTAIYTKLSEKGYLTKTQSAEDHRTFYIHLTDKGKALQSVHNNLHKKIAQHFSKALSQEELGQFERLLQKIISAV
jgi:DNA-binding MarR family transcriptional regulator